jgi:hypothetical protein
MVEPINFKLQASKAYLSLSILIHVCILIGVWFADFNNYINLTFSVVLITHFKYLMPHILLTKSNAILSFSLVDNKIITTDKTNNQQKYTYVYCAYQSRLLVIIITGKRSLIIFKDALANHSLSQLNRLLNA